MTAHEPPAAMAEAAAPLHVLLVDAREADIALVRHCLDDGDRPAIELTAVPSVTRAQAILETAPPDLIVTELRLADVRGALAYESLRAAAPGIPLIVLTGAADPQMAIHAIESGADDYVVKGELETGSLGRRLRQTAARARRLRAGAVQRTRLEYENTQLRNLLDLAPQGILLLDSQHRVLFANRRGARLLARPRDGLQGVRLDLDALLDSGTLRVSTESIGWQGSEARLILLEPGSEEQQAADPA